MRKTHVIASVAKRSTCHREPRRGVAIQCVNWIASLAFAMTIILIISATSFAIQQVDVNVYDDVVYSYLAKLASRKLIKTYSPNQRPLSRFTVARLVVEARGRLIEAPDEGVEPIMRELENEFSADIALIDGNKGRSLEFRPIDTAGFSWTATNQQEEAMPSGLGTTSGTVQPLLDYKDGQRYEKYSNFYFDTSHRLSATPYFSFYVQPLFYLRSGDIENGGITLYRGYVKTGYKNFELQVGRDALIWGPGEYSLLFSNNAHAQDMIRLTTPSTFRLPWVLKHLGQWRFTAFFSLLSGDYQPKNTILSGYRVDYQPAYWLDLGFDHAVMMGGEGAVNPSVTTAIGEFIGFLFNSGNSRASSNHLMGADATFHIPPLLGMEVYGKVLLEDTQQEYGFMLINDANWLGGIYFPRLDKKNRLSLRGEFIYTGQFSYRHGFYRDGFALDDKFMGYDAGSDTYSAYITSTYQFNLNEFIRANARYLYRSSDQYGLTFDSNGNNNGIYVSQKGITEHHFLFKLAGQKKITKVMNIYGEAGIDAVKNDGFRSGNNDVDFSTQVKLVFHDLSK